MSEKPIDMEDPKIASFVNQLMLHNSQEREYIFQQLAESFERDYEREMCRLSLIRERISYLCSQDWTPSTHAIVSALYPSDSEVESALTDIRKREGKES